MTRERSKRFTEIVWRSKDGVDIRVPVNVVRSSSRYGAPETISFRAKYEPANVDESATDIEVLRKAVTEKLKAWHQISWTLWIKVSIKGTHANRQAGDGYEIEVGWDYLALGTDANGNEFYMEVPVQADWSGTYAGDEQGTAAEDEANVRGLLKALEGLPHEVPRWSGSYVRNGKPTVGREPMGGGNVDETESLVPATEANLRALIAFRLGMEALVEKLHEHFAPARVEAFLTRPALLSIGKAK